MNTKSIDAASRVICKAVGQPKWVPATVAIALESTGWLNTPETFAELERLRLLQNAQPAHLTKEQTDALSDAGNRALNDHYHEDLCHCSDWPESCVSSGHYFAGRWDTAAFDVGMAAVIGAWEAMRAPAEADEVARLRARVAELEADRNREVSAWLGKKAREYRSTSSRESASEVLERMADKVSRGAIRPARPVEDPHDSPLHHTYRLGHDLPEARNA